MGSPSVLSLAGLEPSEYTRRCAGRSAINCMEVPVRYTLPDERFVRRGERAGMKTCAVVFGIITLGIVAIVVAIAVPETIANYHATQTSHATATAIAHDVAPTPGVALPTMTADQRAYFGQISERVNTLESSVANFQQLMQDVTDTPALRFDARSEERR